MKKHVLLITFLLPLFALSQVIYTDIVPDYYQNSSGEKTIDADQNGTTDLLFSLTILNPLTDVWFVVNTDTAYSELLTDPSAFGFIKRLEAGAVIDANGAWKSGNQVSLAYLTSGQAEGPWPGSADKYLAFRLKKAKQYYYGWLRMNVNSKVNNYTLKDYAFQSKANEAIKAGDKNSTGIARFDQAELEWRCDREYVYLQQLQNGVQAELYDLEGKLVSAAGENNGVISLPRKGKGLFVLLLRTDAGMKPYKLYLNE